MSYYNGMTMVAAVLAKDGIACIGDGRGFDEHGNIVPGDHAVKLFDFSDFCVIMPDGGFFANGPEVLGRLKTDYAKSGVKHVTDVAMNMTDGLKKICGTESGDNEWGLIFAGYDIANGLLQPKIWKTDSATWSLVPQEIRATGGLDDKANEVFDQEFSMSNLTRTNSLVLKAMLKTMTAHPYEVAGDIALWNIKPGKINKLSKSRIKKLISEIKYKYEQKTI